VTDRAQGRPWTLRRRIGFSAAAVGALLAVLVAAVAIATIQFVRVGNRVIYSAQPIVSATDRLLVDVVNQESSLRGLALTRDAAFAGQYRQYADALRRDLTHARSLVNGDDQLSRRLTGVQDAARRWQVTVAEPALSRLAAGDAGAVLLLDGVAARRSFDGVRTAAAALSTTANQRAEDARHSRTRYAIIWAAAVSLTVIMLVVIAAAIWRGLHRWVLGPIDGLATQTRLVARGDTYRHIEPSGPPELTGLGRDVEAMRLQIAGQLARAEEIYEQLQQRTDELTRSNDDLQQFAYVASHDLSEPLRKVANFCQLLERQYRDQLDDRAKQYIDFAVDGAKRMQALITDLLTLSRVGRTTEQFVPVSLDDALDRALDNLSERIDSAGATIERLTPLPTVNGDPALLGALLENLVSNAIKYRRPDVSPVVRIAAERVADEGAWTVCVSDDGIGIDPQYAERIFAVFQRLHLRDSYGGTGIGLAICRKIVEFHGGHIWLDTVASASGATFKFVLPEGGILAQSRD